MPALERMMASVTLVTPSSWPMTRLWSSSSKCSVLFRSLSVSLVTGIPVQREMILAISSSDTFSRTRERSAAPVCSSCSSCFFKAGSFP